MDFFWNVFGGFFGGIFWEKLFGRIVLGGFVWEGFFGRNYLIEINKELMLLSRFWGNFVSIQGRKKEEEEF